MGIQCVGVSKCQSEDSFVCFGAKPTQRACARDFLRDRTREGRFQGRTDQSTGESSRQKSGEADGRTNVVGQREKISQHSWWLRENFARIHARDSSQNARKVSQTSPFLRLELTQFRICSLFFHHLGCVLCVRKEMWNIPGRKWEKPLDDRGGNE